MIKGLIALCLPRIMTICHWHPIFLLHIQNGFFPKVAVRDLLLLVPLVRHYQLVLMNVSICLKHLINSGIDPAVMIPGTGLTNLPDTARLTRHAVDQGCQGAMILPPFYFKGVSDEGLYNYYKELIRMVDHPELRIYLYHIPQVAHVGLSIELVKRLYTDFPEVVGIKDLSGDWENTAALLDIDGLIVYPGAELPVIEAIRRGAPGCISATANLNGVGIDEVIQLCHQGDYDVAEEKHIKVKAIRMLFQDYAPIPSQKALLARWSGDAQMVKFAFAIDSSGK